MQKGKLVTKPWHHRKGHNQTLNPELEGEGQTSFDPGETASESSSSCPTHPVLGDKRNSEAAKHAMRIYPCAAEAARRFLTPVVMVDEDGRRFPGLRVYAGEREAGTIILPPTRAAREAAAEGSRSRGAGRDGRRLAPNCGSIRAAAGAGAAARYGATGATAPTLTAARR